MPGKRPESILASHRAEKEGGAYAFEILSDEGPFLNFRCWNLKSGPPLRLLTGNGIVNRAWPDERMPLVIRDLSQVPAGGRALPGGLARVPTHLRRIQT